MESIKIGTIYSCSNVIFGYNNISCSMPAGVGKNLPILVTICSTTINAGNFSYQRIIIKYDNYSKYLIAPYIINIEVKNLTLLITGGNFGPTSNINLFNKNNDENYIKITNHNTTTNTSDFCIINSLSQEVNFFKKFDF